MSTFFAIGCDEDGVKEEVEHSNSVCKLNLHFVMLVCLKCGNIYVCLVSAQVCVLLLKHSLFCC
jgi:hypothetical protein